MEAYTGAYFGALGREARAFWDGGAGAGFADTVFIGGGTPSSVDAAHITEILGRIPRKPPESTRARQTSARRESARHAPEDADWECTVEANPGTLGGDKLEAYRGAGANRLSVGLQSTHASHLRMLGRAHTAPDFFAACRAARGAGFDNISADLLFGLPGQTLSEWERTLEDVLSADVRHLSCYSLSLEDGTPLRAAVANGELPAPDEDADREMYAFAVSYLRTAGLYQYELSNFAAPGFECRHNLKYWTGARYIGFGAGAHSYDGAVRFSNAVTIPEYIEMIERCGAAVIERTGIDEAEREKEFIILRLRLTRGFADAKFQAAFGYSFFDRYARQADELTALGLIETGADEAGRAPDTAEAAARRGRRGTPVRTSPGRRVRLTPRGMDLANRVFLAFI